MDLSGLTRPVTDLLAGAMDRAPILGYTRIGSGLRRHWWPARLARTVASARIAPCALRRSGSVRSCGLGQV